MLPILSAYQDSDGASFGERLGNARLAATGAGIIAGTAAAKMTGRDFAKAGETAISEGKAAYSEGADARIAAFKSELRGEAPISAGSLGGSGAVDSSYDSRYAPPPSDTNAAGVAAGAVGAATAAASSSAGAAAGPSATLSTGGNAPLGEVAGDDGYGQGEAAASAAAMAAGVSRAGAADSPFPSSPPCLPMAHRKTLWPIRVTASVVIRGMPIVQPLQCCSRMRRGLLSRNHSPQTSESDRNKARHCRALFMALHRNLVGGNRAPSVCGQPSLRPCASF